MPALFRRRTQLIIIVCSANVTRSPYFARRLKNELESLDIPDRKLPTITSAGVRAELGIQAHPVLQTVARMRGMSLSDHRSKPFDDDLAKQADLVLTMEQWHSDEILIQHPELEGKVLPMLAYGREGEWQGELDVPDPTGGEPEDYQAFIDLADAQAQRLRRWFGKFDSFPPPSS